MPHFIDTTPKRHARLAKAVEHPDAELLSLCETALRAMAHHQSLDAERYCNAGTQRGAAAEAAIPTTRRAAGEAYAAALQEPARTLDGLLQKLLLLSNAKDHEPGEQNQDLIAFEQDLGSWFDAVIDDAERLAALNRVQRTSQ